MARLLAAITVLALGFVAYAGLPMLWSEPPAPREPWDGPALADMTSEEIAVEQDGLRLGGLVFAPEEVRGVVVVIHGSGPSRREHGWYTRLATYLNDRDIALVLPDKRGSEASDGDWRSASPEDLAKDAAAFVDLAAERWPTVPLTVLGASQGGWIAPMVANLRPEAVDRVISQSAAAVPAVEQLTHEERNTLISMGMPAPAARVIAPLSAWSIRAVRQRELWEGFTDFDALDHWAEVAQPVLMIYGALDEADNVPVARSVHRLGQQGASNREVVVLDGLGHSMNAPGSGVVDPRFLALVAEFALPRDV